MIIFQRNEYFAMFIDKNINLALKSLFATQMTMFILCRYSCTYSDIFAKVGFRIIFQRNEYFVMFIDKNINLALKSLFATLMTMLILCRISNHVVLILDCSFCDEFATWDNFNALATSA